MTDYRTDLYGSYVSAFKGFEEKPTVLAEAASTRFFDRKYYPHLSHLKPDDPILDVGCGTGSFLERLSAKGFHHVEGIDISAEQVAMAKVKGLNVQCFDAFSFLGDQVEAYQAIIALDLVEHFTKEEVLRLLQLMFRALKDDGVLLLQTPNGQGLFASQVIYGDLTHCTIFTPGSLSHALRLAGFEEVLFTETGPVAKNWKGCVRLALWNAIKLVANFVRRVEAGKRQEIWTENLICVCRKPTGGQHVNQPTAPRR